MRRLALLAIAVTLTSITPAAQAAPTPRGVGCGMAAEWNAATAPPYQFSAAAVGGPVTLGDSTLGIVHFGRLVCTIQVNAPAHNGPDMCNVVGPWTTGVVAAAGPCPFSAGKYDTVYLCTRVELGTGQVLYASGTSWTTNAASTCATAITYICDAGNTPCDLKNSLLDPLLCPIFAPFFPPQGDIGIFWDCPPYAMTPSGAEFIVHAVVPTPVT